MMQPPKELKIISGYVENLTFGSSAATRTAKVAVVSDDGNAYAIMPKGLGTELAQHVNALVEVKGEIKTIPGSTPDASGDAPGDALGEETLFHVWSYNIRDGYDDAWYDEE